MISRQMLVLGTSVGFLIVNQVAWAEENSKQPIQDKRAITLFWADEHTGKPLFNTQDIVCFDWDKQAFELTHDAAMDFEAWFPPHMQLDRAFVVRDSNGIIYQGKRVSSASSFSYQVPAICEVVFENGGNNYHSNKPPFYEIIDGYPQGSKKAGHLRRSERLRLGLEKSRVLGKLDPAHPPKPLEVVRTEWTGKKDLRIRIEVFAETVRLGLPVRAHLFASNYPRSDLGSDTATVNMTLRANDGRFLSQTQIAGIPLKKCVEDGVWICRFTPWSSERSSLEGFAKPGPATLTAELLLLNRSPPSKDSRAGSNVVRAVLLPKVALKVLPAQDK